MTGRLDRGRGTADALRLAALPIVAQDAEQLLGQHDVAILAAFGLADVDHHARAVDVS